MTTTAAPPCTKRSSTMSKTGSSTEISRKRGHWWVMATSGRTGNGWPRKRWSATASRSASPGCSTESSSPTCVATPICSVREFALCGRSAAHHRGAGDERLELPVRRVAGQVLHAAVGGGDELLRPLVGQRAADPGRDRLGRFDRLVVEVDHAEDDRLCGEG